jgi:hypothetical protein
VDIPPEDQTTLVRVDVEGLAGFAKELRAEVDSHLRPYLDELIRTYQEGPRFGPSVQSENIAAARAHYQRCLGQMINQLYAFARGGTVLADAADIIVQHYRDADALAAASVAAVKDAVTAAERATPFEVPVDPLYVDNRVSVNGRGAM